MKVKITTNPVDCGIYLAVIIYNEFRWLARILIICRNYNRPATVVEIMLTLNHVAVF